MANQIPEGYDLVVGRSRDKAREALALAEERGLEPESVLSVAGGFLVKITDESAAEAEIGEIEIPKDSASHDDIDAFATEWGLSYDGIEAANPEKPTKAEKIAHLTKALAAKAAENDAHLAATGELRGSDTQNQED